MHDSRLHDESPASTQVPGGVGEAADLSFGRGESEDGVERQHNQREVSGHTGVSEVTNDYFDLLAPRLAPKHLNHLG